MGIAGPRAAQGTACARPIGQRRASEAAVGAAQCSISLASGALAALVLAARCLLAGWLAVAPVSVKDIDDRPGANRKIETACAAADVAPPRPPRLPQVIIAYLLGSIFFHDPITALGLAGTALIACGVVVVNLEKLLALAAARKGGGGGGNGDTQSPTEQHPPEGAPQAAWWRRLLLLRREAEQPPLKAKRSDLEAELGSLPGPSARQHQYRPVGG